MFDIVLVVVNVTIGMIWYIVMLYLKNRKR